MKLAKALTATTIATVGYCYYGNTFPILSSYNVYCDKIPTSFNDYKILHVSDFHNTANKVLRENLIKTIIEEKPNIIVITGDIVDSRHTNYHHAITFLEDLVKIAEVYYVTGNHEGRLKDYHILETAMHDLKVNVLHSTNNKLFINDDYINLIGLDDIRFSKLVREKDRGKSAIKETLQQLKDDSTFNLLLSHRPELFDTYASSKVDLVFCGHAHGGQIRIKNQGGFAPGQGFIPKYTAGVHTKETTTMVVSRGIGNSLAPFRINNNPEIISVTLKCKEKSQ